MKFTYAQAYKYGMENGKPKKQLNMFKYAIDKIYDISDLPDDILEKFMEIMDDPQKVHDFCITNKRMYKLCKNFPIEEGKTIDLLKNTKHRWWTRNYGHFLFNKHGNPRKIWRPCTDCNLEVITKEERDYWRDLAEKELDRFPFRSKPKWLLARLEKDK